MAWQTIHLYRKLGTLIYLTTTTQRLNKASFSRQIVSEFLRVKCTKTHHFSSEIRNPDPSPGGKGDTPSLKPTTLAPSALDARAFGASPHGVTFQIRHCVTQSNTSLTFNKFIGKSNKMDCEKLISYVFEHKMLRSVTYVCRPFCKQRGPCAYNICPS